MNIAETPPKLLDLLSRFVAIVGNKNAITDREAQAPYLTEPRDMFRGASPVVLRPGSVAEVAEILKLANSTSTAIVPQGGNTGLVGGQIPQHGEIVLALNRLDRVREVDPVSNTMTCEAGVTLRGAREAAADVDRLYPQLLPSEGSCTIGGNLSTNAGGTAALAHGIARSHALGIEGGVPRAGGAAHPAAAFRGDRLRRRALAAGRARPLRACERARHGQRDQLRVDAA